MMPLPRLRALRLRAMLSQAELAKRAGVGEITIHRIEHGQLARLVTTRKIAECLGVTLADLQGGSDVVETG